MMDPDKPPVLHEMMAFFSIVTIVVYLSYATYVGGF